MTELTIDFNHLTHNFRSIKKQLNKATKIIGVVKANAYGLGAVPIAKKLCDLGVDWLAVAYAQEGIALREAGIQHPILVFYPQYENLPLLVEHELEPAMYSREILSAFEKVVLEKKRTHYPIHLKCNTGLNRIGLSPQETIELGEELKNRPFKIQSVYSHLGASENEKPCVFTQQQIQLFVDLKEKMQSRFTSPTLFHLLNTSGVFNYPEYQFDAVRTGIGLYGFANQEDWNKALVPIAQLASSIVQIHHLNKGESVGYNLGWVAEKPSVIAVLPLGHADGIGRQYGHGKGKVVINKKIRPIVGNVCMDMVMVDVTGVDCKVNDTAIIFNAEHSASEFAKPANTISYELLTGLSVRIPRNYKS